MVEDSEGEEEDEEEESGLEYETDTPSKDSYMTPPSTGGCSKPSLAPSHSPTLADSNPKNNAVLHTEELEACIEAFLEEAEEDMEMSDLPPCHCYDFLVCFRNGLNFFKLLFSLGIDHDPPCFLCSHDLCLFPFLCFILHMIK